MISGKLPFEGDTIYVLFENISKAEYHMPMAADAILADLISGVFRNVLR
jgi:hypothetical protein